METENPVPLLDAMLDGADYDQVKLLIESGADVNACTEFGSSPIFEAVVANDREIVRLLLENGADPNAEWRLESENGVSSSLSTKVATWVFQKLIPKTPAVILTPASECNDPEIARTLVDYGVPVEDFDHSLGDCMFHHATGAALIPHIELTADMYNTGSMPKFGKTNPDRIEKDFWVSQIQTYKPGYSAAYDLFGKGYKSTRGIPVWSFQRFGRSYTTLQNGDLVLIAGEHEDHYDSDFNIYNDVTVLDGKGGVVHYSYPKDVFPPTDFHTATLFADHILLIGSLGHSDARRIGETQVFRLNLGDFSISSVETSGQSPGWISNHTADLDGTVITISGGKVQTNEGYLDRNTVYTLDTATMVWAKMD